MFAALFAEMFAALFEYLIVALIVGAAGWRFALPYLRRARSSDAACGSGCGGCSSRCEPPAGRRVIPIRRAG